MEKLMDKNSICISRIDAMGARTLYDQAQEIRAWLISQL